MMGADRFRTLHISLHHLGKLLISLIFSAHKAPLSLLPSRDIFSCIKVWINMPLEKKSCFLTIQNRGRLTSHLQSLTNVFSQSPAHSPDRKTWFRHNRLSAAKPISQQSCLFSVFLFFQQTYLSSQKGGRNLHSRTLCKNVLFFSGQF